MPKVSRPFYWLERLFWSLHSHTWDEPLQTPEGQDRVQARVDWLTGHCRGGGDNERVVARILDLGCGTGNYALALAKAGFDVVGLDFAPGMLDKARTKAAKLPEARPSVIFEQADLNRDLPFPDASFDHVLCVLALQCVAQPSRFLREARRVLKDSGLFLIVVPSFDSRAAGSCRKQKISLLQRIFAQLKRWANRSSRVQKLTRDELASLLVEAGFEIFEERAAFSTIELLVRTARP